MIQIDYLADFPEYIEVLAPLVSSHWKTFIDGESIDARTTKFLNHLNCDLMPLSIVAHSRGSVVGTAALRVNDLDGSDNLSPWLGGVYVLPEFRQSGIGALLCSEIERIAQQKFDVKTLYLFTLDKLAWYSGLGWSVHSPFRWHIHNGHIMYKELG